MGSPYLGDVEGGLRRLRRRKSKITWESLLEEIQRFSPEFDMENLKLTHTNGVLKGWWPSMEVSNGS